MLFLFSDILLIKCRIDNIEFEGVFTDYELNRKGSINRLPSIVRSKHLSNCPTTDINSAL